MDTLVTIAEFNELTRALFLKSLLESEGITCFLQDQYISQVYGTGIIPGGVKLQVSQNDVNKATEIMIAHGYEKDSVLIEDNKEDLESSKTIFSNVPYLRHLSYPAQMWTVLLLTIILGTLLGLLSYFFTYIK